MAKKSKKKVVQNPKAERTRNAKTITESQYFNKIRQALRKEFRYWKPAAIAKQLSSREYKGPNKLQKKEYQCNKCKHWFKEKETQVDHVEECGSLRCLEDIAGFVERLTREKISDFQVLCRDCHKTKTQNAKKSRKPDPDLLSQLGSDIKN